MREFATVPWRSAASAPRDGTRVLVLIGASEQGDADVDVAHWGRQKYLTDPCWVSSESSADCAVIYGAHEVTNWMPLPQWTRPVATAAGSHTYGTLEIDGSGI